MGVDGEYFLEPGGVLRAPIGGQDLVPVRANDYWQFTTCSLGSFEQKELEEGIRTEKHF